MLSSQYIKTRLPRAQHFNTVDYLTKLSLIFTILQARYELKTYHKNFSRNSRNNISVFLLFSNERPTHEAVLHSLSDLFMTDDFLLWPRRLSHFKGAIRLVVTR